MQHVTVSSSSSRRPQRPLRRKRPRGDERVVVHPAQLEPGVVKVHGYKHAMVAIIAAAVAASAHVELVGAPPVDDTFVLAEILGACGARPSFSKRTLSLDTTTMTHGALAPHLSTRIHGSLYLFPAHTMRFGNAEFEGSGGCQIGSRSEDRARPVHHIFSVMERFGAVVEPNGNGGYRSRVSRVVNDVVIDIRDYSTEEGSMAGPLVGGATKTALICGLSARRTEIRHPYLKTDVLDLLRFLESIGCTIERHPNAIVLHGRPVLSRPVRFELTSCISEIMTYTALSVHLGVRLCIRDVTPDRWKRGVSAELELLRQMGVVYTEVGGDLLVTPPKRVRSVDIDVTPDGIQSDHAPFFALMMLRGNRRAEIRERVWTERFGYVPGLRALGLDVEQTDHTLVILPSRATRGADLHATDVRAGATLLLASLGAPTSSRIEGFEHVHRGYPQLVERVRDLGAVIEVQQ